MTSPPVQEYQLEQLLRYVLRCAREKTILLTPSGDYTAVFTAALETAGFSYTIIAPEAVNGYTIGTEWPIDLRRITSRFIYPYTLEKLMDGVRKFTAAGRIVRIIPSEQTNQLTAALEQENISYYIADPKTEPDFNKEYEINLLDIGIVAGNH